MTKCQEKKPAEIQWGNRWKREAKNGQFKQKWPTRPNHGIIVLRQHNTHRGVYWHDNQCCGVLIFCPFCALREKNITATSPNGSTPARCNDIADANGRMQTTGKLWKNELLSTPPKPGFFRQSHRSSVVIRRGPWIINSVGWGETVGRAWKGEPNTMKEWW